MLIVFPKTEAVKPNDLLRINLEGDDHISFRAKTEYEPDYGNRKTRKGERQKRTRLAKLISSCYGVGTIPGIIVSIGDAPWDSNLHLLPLSDASFNVSPGDRGIPYARNSGRYDASVEWDNGARKWVVSGLAGTVVDSESLTPDKSNGRSCYGKVVGVRSLVAALLTQAIELPYNFLVDNFDHVNINFENASVDQKSAPNRLSGRFRLDSKSKGELFAKLKGTWFIVKYSGDNIESINPIHTESAVVENGRVMLPESVPADVFSIKTIQEVCRQAEVYIDVGSNDETEYGPNEDNTKSLARGKNRRWVAVTITFPTEEARYTEAAALEQFARLGIEGVDHYDETAFTSYGSIDGSSVAHGKHDFGIVRTLGVFFKPEVVEKLVQDDERSRGFPRFSREFKDNLLSIDPAGISDIDIRRICNDWRVRNLIQLLATEPDVMSKTKDELNELLEDVESGDCDLFDWNGAPVDDEASIKISKVFAEITEKREVYLPIITPRIEEDAANQLAHIFERRLVNNLISDNAFHFKTIRSL